MVSNPLDGDLVDGGRVSRYRLIERLGAGGGGVVYRAHDEELDRPVALKFLFTSHGDDEQAARRFLQEARAASALDHPNICTIYEIGRSEGQRMFIAMAFYEGETLRSMLRERPVTIAESVHFGTQIARGLSKAHENGIIHRDIKPANLLVTSDGVLKILDFGVAKVGGTNLTQTGGTVGTVAYMSPEQLDGEGHSPSTDLWAWGVVMYEMLTGEPVFGNGSQLAVMGAILTQDPGPLVARRPDCPDKLSDLVGRCLQKDAKDRIATSAELLQELATIDVEGIPESGSSTAPPKWIRRSVSHGRTGIVVKPFADLSPAGDNEFLSDGLTDEIITDLSGIRDLRVISRSSALTLKGSSQTVGAIGQSLNVRYVLEGAVRRHGDRLRITAQLNDTETEEQIWAQKYDGSFDDVFDIQDRVSLAIVEALELEISPTEERRLVHRPIDNARAYECYLRARQDIWGMTPESLDSAESLLLNGLELVGDNALIHAGLAFLHWQRFNIGLDADGLKKAEQEANLSIALDPELPQAEYALGLLAMAQAEPQKCATHLKRTIRLDPSNADGISALVTLYAYCGHSGSGFPLLERLVSVDPLTPIHKATTGLLHLLDGRFARAADQYGQMYRVSPANPYFALTYAQALAYADNRAEALVVLDKLAESEGGSLPEVMGRFLKYALLGDRTRALEAMTPELKAGSTTGMVQSWICSIGYAMIDEKEAALDCLAGAVESGFINFPFFAHFDPFLESLRGEQRFKSIMAQAETEWRAFSP